MKRLGVLAAGCGAFAATAALGAPAAIAQTPAFITNIVYTSHDTTDAAQARLACDAATPSSVPPGSNTTNCHIYAMNTDGAGKVITSGNNNDVDPAFSPDGSKIAFARAVGGPSGQYDIYVMNSDGTGLTKITDSPKDDRYPAWKPDGTKIAYRGYPAVGGAAIFIMDPNGATKINIQNTGGGDQPAWSPDGTKIAYSGTHQGPQNGCTQDPNPLLPCTPTYASDDDIFVQAVNAGNNTVPQNVTNSPTTSDRYPSWQPIAGSTQILFRRIEASGREVWKVNQATGQASLIGVSATGGKGRAASWAPDGVSAAFVSTITGNPDQEIWFGTVNNIASNAPTISPARALTANTVNDDEPKLANVPVPVSAVPPAVTPTTTGTTKPGVTPGVVGTVSGGGTTITVGGGTLSDGTKSLGLTLVVPKQKLLRKKTIRAFVTCTKKCTVTLSGLTKLKVGSKTKTLRLFGSKKTLQANSRSGVQLRLPTSTLTRVRTALRRKKAVKFQISASARTSNGEFTPTAIRPVTLRK